MLPKLFWTMSPQDLWVRPYTDTRAWNAFKVRCPGGCSCHRRREKSAALHAAIPADWFPQFFPSTDCIWTDQLRSCLLFWWHCAVAVASLLPRLHSLSPRVSSCYLPPQFCPKWKSEDSCWSDWLHLQDKTSNAATETHVSDLIKKWVVSHGQCRGCYGNVHAGLHWDTHSGCDSSSEIWQLISLHHIGSHPSRKLIKFPVKAAASLWRSDPFHSSTLMSSLPYGPCLSSGLG